MQVTLDIPDELVTQAVAMSVTRNRPIDSILSSALARGIESKRSRGKSIKEGIAKSGYVPKGKSPNKELHSNIMNLLSVCTCSEVAATLGCGIATVYRVRKQYLQN